MTPPGYKTKNTRGTPRTKSFCSWSMAPCLCLFLFLLVVATIEASAPVAGSESSVFSEDEENSNGNDNGNDNGNGNGNYYNNYRFVHKTVIIPHDDKKHRGGEDAASTTDEMIVVADGVGGWANRGVNPGLYSRKLTETITSRFSAMRRRQRKTTTTTTNGKAGAGSDDGFDLRKLVHESNHEAANAHLGSATCTVVRLKDALTLETLNVGDSGYSIHRRATQKDGSGSNDDNNNNRDDLEVVYASVPGQKGFNFPYQLGGKYGDQVYEPNVTDGPNTHALEEKDVIVVVSDGVIDNIDPGEYHECIDRYQWKDDSGSHPSSSWFEENDLVSYFDAADCIAKKAYFLGKDKRHFSPFARSAATYGKRYLGGKHDDITVVVAQVETTTGGKKSKKEDYFDKTEGIFVYKDSDGPITDSTKLPTLGDVLDAMAAAADSDDENHLEL